MRKKDERKAAEVDIMFPALAARGTPVDEFVNHD